MADSTVLREYLIALGFKTDEAKAKKFDQTINKFSGNVMALGKGLLGVATAAQAMVTVFAFQMEKLYYASMRTKASVGNIQALEYGASRIGLTGDQVRQSLEGMAKVLRTQPGMMELLRNFGVKTDQDGTKMMLGLVKELAKMPHWLGAQWAEMFGMDEQTFLMLKAGAGELERSMELRKEMAADAGVDADAAAAAGKEYANQLRDIWEKIGLMKDAISLNLLGPMREVAGVTSQVLTDWTKIISGQGQKTGKGVASKDWWNLLDEALGLTSHDSVAANFTNDTRRRIKGFGVNPLPKSEAGAGRGSVNPGMPGPLAQSDFGPLEEKYGLPEGMLDRVWNAESARGKHMRSPAGAKGHFGFMDPTAKQYGVTDPDDLGQSSTGAAKYLSDLMKKYGGDASMAAAAYNWGPGNLDRKGLGAAPAETRDYVKKVAGVTIDQKVDIHVAAGENAEATGRAVAREQSRVGSDLVRDAQGVVE